MTTSTLTTRVVSLGLGGLLTLVAVILFVLAGFGASFHSFSELDLISFGLAFYAAGTLIP